MRNFKKILSLVLCMAMMLSVMVVGAGAAFKDQSKIVNKEAVDMCVALNIINGYTDGSYKPEGNVTRAEMCKMICIALNGGKEPATATKAVPTYSDIDGHWAEGYIEYCNTKGIVAGVGGGKFNPNGNVTGSQAAKMLLIALGYNADVEKYVGASWELYVNVQANQDGLYEDLESMDPSAALSRDNAAQMIWNALQAYVINKESSIDRTDGSIVDSYVKSTTPLLSKQYKGIVKEGTLVSFDYNSKDAEWTYTVDFSRTVTANDDSSTGYVDVVSSTDYTDLLGQKVKAVYTVKNNENSAYGIFATDSEVLFSSVVGDLPTIKTNDTSITIDGVKYKIDTTATVTCVNDLPVYKFQHTNDYKTNGTTLGAFNVATNYAQVVTAVDFDGNGKVDFLMTVPFQVAKVTYMNGTDFTTTKTAKQAVEDANVYAGMAKNDYVVYTAAANTADETDTFVKADLISGDITAVKGTHNDNAKVDGTWYIFDVSYDTTNYTKDCAPGTTLTDAVVVNGYIFAADAVNQKAVTDYAIVVATDKSTFDGAQAKLLFSNGDKTVVDTTKDYKNGETGVAPIAPGTLVTYTKNADGEYTLTPASTSGTGFDLVKAGSDVVVTKVSNSSGKAGYINSASISDDAVIFINYEGSSYKVITGAQMKKMDTNDFDSYAKAFLLATKSGNTYNVDMAYVSIGSDKINDADTYYGYITGVEQIENADGDTVKSVTVVTENGTQTYAFAGTSITGDSATRVKAGNVIEYKLNSDNEISEIIIGYDVDGHDTVSTQYGKYFATVAISALSPTFQYQLKNDTTVYTQYGGKFLETDSDTVYLYIENTDQVGADKVDISVADDAEATDCLIPNAFIVFEADGDIALLVYDVDNDIAE